ncbi:MAG: prolyl oligopeptidase family serine peptidase, partial [Balneolaceae bacterium]
DGYIPRIYWTQNSGELAVTHLNRTQNHLKLYFYNVAEGTGELIMEERAEKGWIDIYDFSGGIDDHFFFPDGREEFFWISDRDGRNHIYRYSYNGTLLNQVTQGEWDVVNVHAVTPETETIWYESTEPSPLERHLYSIHFNGDGKARYSEAPGRHHFSMGSDGRYYLDRYSNTETPTRVELWKTGEDRELLLELVENEQVNRFIDEYIYAPKRLFQFETTDGVQLDGSMIKPVDFNPDSTYPLLLNIYGGPGSQGVYNEFETSGWLQYLAQAGYVIANVNNRGSGGYGREFKKIVYRNLGQWEANDFAETARWLSETHSWIDGDRMAIRGHSYGGYMAALTPLLHPGLFQVSIVTAPVTSWLLYDTIYTERYMGLPDENREGYKESSVMAHASRLNGKMLVAHSSMDENVHIQNTMQMIRAFTDAGKDIDLRIYPPGEHGVAYSTESYLLLYKTYTDYLNRFLK